MKIKEAIEKIENLKFSISCPFCNEADVSCELCEGTGRRWVVNYIDAYDLIIAKADAKGGVISKTRAVIDVSKAAPSQVRQEVEDK